VPKGEKERKRKSSVGDGTTEGATTERTSALHKEKCAGEWDEVL